MACGGKTFDHKMCSDGLKQPFPNFLFSRRAIFSFFLPEIKTKIQSFHFFTVDNSDIRLQESRVAFYFNVFKKQTEESL